MNPVHVLTALACAGLLAACSDPDVAPVADDQAQMADAGDAATTDDTPASEPIAGTGSAEAQPGAIDVPIAEVTEFVASGNEPFWSVEVDGDTLVWSTSEQMPGRTLQSEREDEPGTVRFSGTDDGAMFALEVYAEPCQDSMSGWAHPFTASFTHDGEEVTGCARRATDPVGELPAEDQARPD